MGDFSTGSQSVTANLWDSQMWGNRLESSLHVIPAEQLWVPTPDPVIWSPEVALSKRQTVAPWLEPPLFSAPLINKRSDNGARVNGAVLFCHPVKSVSKLIFPPVCYLPDCLFSSVSRCLLLHPLHLLLLRLNNKAKQSRGKQKQKERGTCHYWFCFCRRTIPWPPLIKR